MLDFKPIQVKSAARLRKYYDKCTYRLCEYSVGVKLMWRNHWHPAYAESHGCLVVLNRSRHLGHIFDYPVPLPGEGDVDAAESVPKVKKLFTLNFALPLEDYLDFYRIMNTANVKKSKKKMTIMGAVEIVVVRCVRLNG